VPDAPSRPPPPLSLIIRRAILLLALPHSRAIILFAISAFLRAILNGSPALFRYDQKFSIFFSIFYFFARCIYLIYIYFERHSRFRYERKSHFTYENQLWANTSGIQRYLRTRVKSETEENYRLMESTRTEFTRLFFTHNYPISYRTWIR